MNIIINFDNLKHIKYGQEKNFMDLFIKVDPDESKLVKNPTMDNSVRNDSLKSSSSVKQEVNKV